MPKITFTEDAHYTEDLKPVIYRVGEVHELREDLCERWRRRGKAVDYVEPPKTAMAQTKKAGHDAPLSVPVPHVGDDKKVK